MAMIIILFCIFSGYLFPRSKKAFFAVCIGITLLLGGYNGDTDLYFYRMNYENDYIIPGYFQKLLYVIFICFHKLGVSFEICHFFILTISVLMIAYVVYHMTSSAAYAMSIISTFSVLELGWQMRAAGAVGMSAIAIYWFYENIYKQTFVKKRNLLIFAVLILLSVQFHYLGIFFILFLLIKKVSRKSLIQLVLAIDIALILCSQAILVVAQKWFFSLATYFSPMSLFSTVVTIIWQLIFSYIVLYAYKKQKHNSFDDFIVDGTILLLLLLPMYRYTVVATRIFRVWVIFIAAYIGNARRHEWTIAFKRLLLDGYNFASFAYWFVLMMLYQGRTPLILELLKENVFS